jgi:hypothetical protein
MYMMRELGKGRSVLSIAGEIGVTYETALEMAKVIRQSLYKHRDQWGQAKRRHPRQRWAGR